MASKREVVVATENYLKSKGYNNSTGKYDRVIMGVKSLLGETLLAYGSPEFERAIQQETERMLKKYVKDSAMEYDPIMCMMVPKKAEDAKTWVVEYEDALGDDHKKTFSDKTAVEKFIRIGTDVGRAYHLKVNGKAVNNMSTWTADSKVNDVSRVIKQRNGYTLGINGSGTIYLAFPGETENNPHMYLGKENDKNLSDAKILFERFASTKDSASMVYDEIMAMMKPATAKDKRTTDFSSGDAKKVFDYIDRQVTKDMNEYPREIERAKTPDDCERLNNTIRSSLENAVEEYLQIWNEVGLYAQKRKNEIVGRYGKLMSQAFKKYNELKASE